LQCEDAYAFPARGKHFPNKVDMNIVWGEFGFHFSKKLKHKVAGEDVEKFP
jgi:hypothetical protein